MPPGERAYLERLRCSDGNAPAFEPRTPFQRRALEIVDEEVGDAYGNAFLVGGLIVLLGIPFALTMRRKPADVHGPEEAAAVAAAG